MEGLLQQKSKAFALKIVGLYKYLITEHKEFVMSKQVLKSGTSIGANCREARRAQSKADFASKLSIALKEADETAFWLELLHESDYIPDAQYYDIASDADELIKILVASIKTSSNS